MYAVPLTNALLYIILHTTSNEKSQRESTWPVTKGVNMEDMLDEITEYTLDGKKVEERNEFQRACDEFVKAEKRFCKLNLSVRMDMSANADGWFAALKQRYVTEERVWELFCSGFETVQMTRLYLSFRDHLLGGESLKPNA
jgi:hypothetical protein